MGDISVKSVTKLQRISKEQATNSGEPKCTRPTKGQGDFLGVQLKYYLSVSPNSCELMISTPCYSLRVCGLAAGNLNMPGWKSPVGQNAKYPYSACLNRWRLSETTRGGSQNLPFTCTYKAQASVEGMEYDRVWTVSMDDTIALHSWLAATAETKEKLGILKWPTEHQAFNQPRHHSRPLSKAGLLGA